MMRPMVLHAIAVCAVAAVTVWLGGMWVGASNPGLYSGVIVAAGFQISAFSVLGLGVLRERQLIAFLMQMVGRFAVLGITAFVLIPGLGLPVAATLLSLVTVFFVTTLLEPVFMHPRLRTGN